jgi:hypothetical protein
MAATKHDTELTIEHFQPMIFMAGPREVSCRSEMAAVADRPASIHARPISPHA